MTCDTDEVIGYYEAMTGAYLRYGGEALALHTGLRDSPLGSREEALWLSNRILVEDLPLGPESRVLDAGCGFGGLAFFLAERLGASVVGVTLCASHAELARGKAHEKGLDGLASFHVQDFMDLDFPAESFDAVLCQDAFCYASDLDRYFQGICRVLKPGGQWRAIDAFLDEGPAPPHAGSLHEAIQDGWKTPPFRPVAEVKAAMRRAGLNPIIERDLRDLALPAARDFIGEERLFALADRLGFLDLADGYEARPIFLSHMAACAGFGRGVSEGWLDYRLLGGAKR